MARKTWLKALGRLDDGPVFWWFTGVTHGLTVDGGLRPLFRHENFSFGPYSRESETRHLSCMQDVTFYRDLESAEYPDPGRPGLFPCEGFGGNLH